MSIFECSQPSPVHCSALDGSRDRSKPDMYGRTNGEGNAVRAHADHFSAFKKKMRQYGEPEDAALREISQSQKGKYCMSHLSGASETAGRREVESGWAVAGCGGSEGQETPYSGDTHDAR